nr:hypothetical protein HmN_000677700 [Hymenolepis microstoma]
MNIRRTNALVKEKHKHGSSQRFNSGLTSTTPIYDDPEPFSATGSSNALALSSSSRIDSIYFDAGDRASPNAVWLDTFNNAQTLTGDRKLQIPFFPTFFESCGMSIDLVDLVQSQLQPLIFIFMWICSSIFFKPRFLLLNTNSLQEEQLYDELQHCHAPSPRKYTSESSVPKSSGHQPPDRQSSTEEPSRSSLLLELDVNIHVDSGCCGLHPCLPKQEGGGVTGLGGRPFWPISPAIGDPFLLQDDL